MPVTLVSIPPTSVEIVEIVKKNMFHKEIIVTRNRGFHKLDEID